MEEILFVITHSIMTACCIWIIVVGMDFKKKDSTVTIEKSKKQFLAKAIKIIEEKKPNNPLAETNEVNEMQLMID